MKLSTQKLELAKKLLFKIQVYFDTLSEFLTDNIKGNLLGIAKKLLNSIKVTLDKYSNTPAEKRRTLNKFRKSMRIKLLYSESLLIALKHLYSRNYPADKLTDFALENINKFYETIN